jgi:hypothetical protein
MRSATRSWWRIARVLLAVVVSLAALAAAAGPALACEPPQFHPGLVEEHVFSTRAHIAASGTTGPTAEASWHGEYATSEALLDEGKGIAAGGETFKLQTPGTSLPFVFALGAEDETSNSNPEFSVLHHLEPSTPYFARFHVKADCGEAEHTFSFTTTPVAKPEIAKISNSENGHTTFRGGATGPRSAAFTAQVESNGADTAYVFEYTTEPGNPGSWKAFTSGASGVVTVAEDFANPEAKLTGLSPETTYFVRVRAENEKGETVQNKYLGPGGSELESFTTPTARPEVRVEVRNVTGTSAHVVGHVGPRGAETSWQFESAPSASGPWAPIAGAAGTISAAEAAALPEEGVDLRVGAPVAGLTPATQYFVRLSATNAAGSSVSEAVGFETEGPPGAATFATHALHGEALRLLGEVDPNSTPTSAEQVVQIEGAPSGGTFTLGFGGQTTEPIAFDASQKTVAAALDGLSSTHASLEVSGPDGGPWTVAFESQLAGVAQPLLVADGSSLSPPGEVKVTESQAGGVTYDAHYHFEYVSKGQFETSGFAEAAATPVVDAGGGSEPVYVGADLPPLTAGETYRFRISATSTFPGNPVIHGGEQSLTAPPAPSGGGEAACANQAFRFGVGELLPDCRAYEQITPVDKEGAQEIFRYEGIAVHAGAAVGEDGEHVMLEAPQVSWGHEASSGQSPYFFARGEKGWSMTAGTVQPEAGLSSYATRLLNPDLTQLGFDASFEVSPNGGTSAGIEYRAGPPGGPYVTVATVTRTQVGGESDGWVAASADFSKLILQVEDHMLVEPRTSTKSGSDLYEYAAGQLRQVNVGAGTCGAHIVNGTGEKGVGQQLASRHAVSADGKRVFFEAVPGSDCSAPAHVYMRVNGDSEHAETVDLGAFRFAAATTDGNTVLLEKTIGENPGLYLYNTGSGTAKFLSASEPMLGASFVVSEDLSAVYALINGGTLDRYSITNETLGLILKVGHPTHYSSSPDGRYFYFAAESVGGLPGGAVVPGCGHETDHELPGLCPTPQVYRYDNAEHLVQCLSCSSSFAPEPRLGAYFGNAGSAGGQYEALGGTPALTYSSTDGSYVFFETPAALVRADVDGEVTPEGVIDLNIEHASEETSVSSDVYEWRKPGVDGCGQPQGCVALITNGRGGLENLLLGTTSSGHDVFVYSHSQLAPSDTDAAGDIYDVRIGGGFPPPPPRPVECQGDACSTSAAAPNDNTPSSLTFTGPGNLMQPLIPPPVNHIVRCRRGARPLKDKKTHRVRCVKTKRHKRKHAKRARKTTATHRRGTTR